MAAIAADGHCSQGSFCSQAGESIQSDCEAGISVVANLAGSIQFILLLTVDGSNNAALAIVISGRSHQSCVVSGNSIAVSHSDILHDSIALHQNACIQTREIGGTKDSAQVQTVGHGNIHQRVGTGNAAGNTLVGAVNRTCENIVAHIHDGRGSGGAFYQADDTACIIQSILGGFHIEGHGTCIHSVLNGQSALAVADQAAKLRMEVGALGGSLFIQVDVYIAVGNGGSGAAGNIGKDTGQRLGSGQIHITVGEVGVHHSQILYLCSANNLTKQAGCVAGIQIQVQAGEAVSLTIEYAAELLALTGVVFRVDSRQGIQFTGVCSSLHRILGQLAILAPFQGNRRIPTGVQIQVCGQIDGIAFEGSAVFAQFQLEQLEILRIVDCQGLIGHFGVLCFYPCRHVCCIITCSLCRNAHTRQKGKNDCQCQENGY